MFRLIKLALYALVGYAIYELYQGMQQDGGTARGQSEADEGRQSERFGERLNVGGSQNLTGRGSGQTERTEEPGGTSTPHAVGRGVIS